MLGEIALVAVLIALGIYGLVMLLVRMITGGNTPQILKRLPKRGRLAGKKQLQVDYPLPFSVKLDPYTGQYEILDQGSLWAIFLKHFSYTAKELRQAGILTIDAEKGLIDLQIPDAQHRYLLERYLVNLQSFGEECQKIRTGAKLLEASGYYIEQPGRMISAFSTLEERQEWSPQTWDRHLKPLSKEKALQVSLDFLQESQKVLGEDYLDMWLHMDNSYRYKILCALSPEFLKNGINKGYLWSIFQKLPLKGGYRDVIEAWLRLHPRYYDYSLRHVLSAQAYEHMLESLVSPDLQDPQKIRAVWDHISSLTVGRKSSLYQKIKDHPQFFTWDYLSYFFIDEVERALDQAYEHMQDPQDFQQKLWTKILALKPQSDGQLAALLWFQKHPQFLIQSNLRLPAFHSREDTAMLALGLMMISPEKEDLLFLQTLPSRPWRREAMAEMEKHFHTRSGSVSLADSEQGQLSEEDPDG